MVRFTILVLSVLLVAPAAFAESKPAKEHFCNVQVDANGGDVGGKTLVLVLQAPEGRQKVSAKTDREGHARFTWTANVDHGEVMVNGNSIGTCKSGRTLRVQADAEAPKAQTNRCSVTVVDAKGRPAEAMVEIHFKEGDKDAIEGARTNKMGVANLTWRAATPEGVVVVNGRRLGKCTNGGETKVSLPATGSTKPTKGASMGTTKGATTGKK